MNDTPGGLGRLPSADPRDRNFPMRSALLDVPLPPHKYWSMIAKPLDQGREGSCVGHAWKHFLMAAPVAVSKPTRDPTAVTIYREAQKRDEWEGEGYEGTSVRAGAKYLTERGMLSTYLWAFDAETVARYVLTVGSVVLGTDWYADMSELGEDGYARIRGRMQGGHAYLALGYSRKLGAFRCVNSWGPTWGPHRGRFWLAGEDLEWLLRQDGEACSAVEVRP